MKKIILDVLCILISVSLLLSACSIASEDSSSSSSSVSENSLAPETESSQPSVEQSSEPEDSSIGESSEPDVSSEVSSEPEVPDDETSQPSDDEILYNTLAYKRDAVGYTIDFTKVDPTAAIQCATNRDNGITAIYDGTVTRFFDAVTGEYYHVLVGKYLVGCCDSFMAGDVNGFNRNNAYEFIFDENGILSVASEENGHAHGGDASGETYFSTNNDVAFSIYEGETKPVYYDDESYLICRQLLLDYQLPEEWTDGDLPEIPADGIGKYGVVRGKDIVIPFEYDHIETDQTADKIGVFRAVKDGKTYYISSNGNILTPDGYTCGSQPYENRAWVFDGEQGYIIEFN